MSVLATPETSSFKQYANKLCVQEYFANSNWIIDDEAAFTFVEPRLCKIAGIEPKYYALRDCTEAVGFIMYSLLM